MFVECKEYDLERNLKLIQKKINCFKGHNWKMVVLFFKLTERMWQKSIQTFIVDAT